MKLSIKYIFIFLPLFSLFTISCGKSTNPYSDLKTGGNFSINSKKQANYLLSYAKSHIDVCPSQTMSSTEFIDFTSDMYLNVKNKDLYQCSCIYWEYVICFANLYNINSYKNISFTTTIPDDKEWYQIMFDDSLTNPDKCVLSNSVEYKINDQVGTNKELYYANENNSIKINFIGQQQLLDSEYLKLIKLI